MNVLQMSIVYSYVKQSLFVSYKLIFINISSSDMPLKYMGRLNFCETFDYSYTFIF